VKGNVGLIGYGRFGRLAARYCAREARVHAYDPDARVTGGGGIRRATLAGAASQPVVILAVPISELRGVLRSIRRFVRPGALIIDVCSVKVLPLAWMKEMLPRSVSVIGMHPLFGPDSAGESIRGHRVVLCPGRAEPSIVAGVRKRLRAAGLLVQEMEPSVHDRFMAETLLLAQYLGRLPSASRIPLRAASTPSYSLVRDLAGVALNDSAQLFRDMWRYNPHGKAVLRKLESGHRLLLKRAGGISR